MKTPFTLGTFCGRPILKFSEDKTMSWSRHRNGRVSAEITLEHDGSLNLTCREIPDDFKGGKETYVTLPAEAVAALVKMIEAGIPA